LSRHARGTILTLAGVVILSPDSLLVRLANTDPWTQTSLRAILVAASLAIWHRATSKSTLIADIRRSGIWDHIFGLCFGLSGICFVVGIGLTTVANVLVIGSFAPAIAALLGYWLLGRQPSRTAWLVILACIVGIAIIAAGEEFGVDDVSGLTGILVTLVSAAMIALGTVAREHAKIDDPRAGMVIGSVVVAVAIAPFSHPSALTLWQIVVIAIPGVVIVPVACFLMFLGPRYIAAYEVGLIALIEAVLGPVWVWLILGEEPARHTLIGGAVVLGAIAYYFTPRRAGSR